MMKILILALFLLASGLKEEAAEDFSEDELLEGIATGDDLNTLDEAGEAEDDEDTYMDLEEMWTDFMEDAGSADDSSADEIEIGDIEEEIRDLEAILEDMEDFETVTIDGVTYTVEELEDLIDDKYDEIVELELSDAIIDLEVLILYAPDQGNLEDFTQGMEAAEKVIQEMEESDTLTITIQEEEYTVEGVDELMDDAESEKNNIIMDLEALDLEGLEIGDTEDSIENYLRELGEVLEYMNSIADKVVIDDIVYIEEDLQVVFDEILMLLDDLDEGKTLEDHVQDIEDQLEIPNLVEDDYLDEIEEIEEVMALTSDPVTIDGEEYTTEDLQSLIDACNNGIHDLEVLAAVDKINNLLQEKVEEVRMDYDDFLDGIQEIEELIELMEPDDIVNFEGDDYTEDDLQELVDVAYIYNEVQLINAAVTEAEENIFSDPPTEEQLADEITILEEILGYISDGSSVTIDEITYTADDLEAYISELEAELEVVVNTNDLLNELGDVQTYIELIGGFVDAEELERLLEELEELQMTMIDGDVLISEDGEEITFDDVGTIVNDTLMILMDLEEGEELLKDDNLSFMVLATAEVPI